jgi:glycosyltransferase involved in cell wall biosynthesis
VYGKISFDPETVPPDHSAKVVPLGPSFPTRTLSLAGTAWRATINYLLARRRIDDPRAHFAHWRRQYEFRLPADAYTPGPCDANYAFFSAALWGDGERGNHDRKLFIDACRSLDWLRFEGGFDKAVNTPKLPGYMMPFDRSHSEYLNKVKRSTVVFNSPARLDCHGWKLAEFLALGKAIISTPQVRQMPAPLEHGRHVHFVERSVESIREAIVLLCRDAAYRSRLEQGARAYYEQHLQPRRAIERLLERGRALSESARARPAGVQASACPAPASRQAGPKEASPSRLGLGTVTSPR